MNKCMQKTEIPERMTKGKTTLIQKDPSKSSSNQRYTHNVPTDDVEILTARIR